MTHAQRDTGTNSSLTGESSGIDGLSLERTMKKAPSETCTSTSDGFQGQFWGLIFILYPRKMEERGTVTYVIHHAYFSVPALLQLLLLPGNQASTLQTQSPTACMPHHTDHSTTCRFPQGSSLSLFSDSSLSVWPLGIILYGLLASLVLQRLVTPKSASPVQTFLPSSRPTFPNAFSVSECCGNTSQFPCPKLNSLSSPPDSVLLQIFPFSVNGSTVSSATMSENRKSPMDDSRSPLSFPWSRGHQVSSQAPNPFLHSCAPPCLVQAFTVSWNSQPADYISPPLMLPFNPPFITTRVSFLKHISAPVLLSWKAFHPTAHKRTSTWSTKHANLFWFCPIFQHSPRATYSLTTYNGWDFQNQPSCFYTFLRCICCAHCLENFYLYFGTQCQYHLLCDVFPNSSSPSELLFLSLCPRNTLKTACQATRRPGI